MNTPKKPFTLLDPLFITHTASIMVDTMEGGDPSHEHEWQEGDYSHELAEVFMDIHLKSDIKTHEDSPEYDLSSPYVVVGKGRKVPAYLTPLELDKLEQAAFYLVTPNLK